MSSQPPIVVGTPGRTPIRITPPSQTPLTTSVPSTTTIRVERLAGATVNLVLTVAARGPRGFSAEGFVRGSHVQSSPAAEWIVNHNLGYRPGGIDILSTGGMRIGGDILHVSEFQFRVRFASPLAGSVLYF